MLTKRSPVTLQLRPEYFTAATPTPFAHWDDLTASAFRYPSGVCGLRLANARGWVDLLPFQGQQIWDAHFLGRSLAMKSIYAGPVPADDYRRSYGAFGVHCGATAMGNPGPLDQHPLHGELPNAVYQSAAVQFGTDSSGRRQLALTGIYHHSVAHTHSYLATPTVRLGEGATVVDVDMEIKNLRNRPMDLMYLCHLNFKPVDGGRLVDTVPPGGLRLRSRVLAGEPEPGLRTDSLPKLAADPEIHRNLGPEPTFDPEAVLFLDYRTDPDGWAHSMQLHPDGAPLTTSSTALTSSITPSAGSAATPSSRRSASACPPPPSRTGTSRSGTRATSGRSAPANPSAAGSRSGPSMPKRRR